MPIFITNALLMCRAIQGRDSLLAWRVTCWLVCHVSEEFTHSVLMTCYFLFGQFRRNKPVFMLLSCVTSLFDKSFEKRKFTQLAYVMRYVLLGKSCEKRNNAHNVHVMCYDLFDVSRGQRCNAHLKCHVLRAVWFVTRREKEMNAQPGRVRSYDLFYSSIQDQLVRTRSKILYILFRDTYQQYYSIKLSNIATG
jgi:hypothetical protein